MILDYSKFIVNKGTKGLINNETYNVNIELFKHDSICPFCNRKIEAVVHSESKTTSPDWLCGSFDESEKVTQCPVCGWWEYEYHNSSDAILDGIRAQDIEYASAILKTYDNSSIEVPVNVLRKYLVKKPEILYGLDAHKMEDLVRSVFSDFYPGCSVKTFGKTRDGGKDGLIVASDGDRWLLQVKRRENKDATEGVTALRELMGVAILEDDLKGCVFVTTADHYSRDAKSYAQAVVDKRIIDAFDLVDYKEFVRLMNVTSERMPNEWEKLLKV